MPWISGAIAAAGAIGGGLLGSSAASKASKSQAKATNQAISQQRLQDFQNRADLAPWREVGGAAVSELGMLMGLTPGGTIVGDPGPEMTGATNYGSGGLQRQSIEAWQKQKAEYDAYLARKAQAEADPRFGMLTDEFTTDDFYDDPVTQLGLKYGGEMGERAIMNRARAAGIQNTGGTIKEMLRFGNDYAGSKANESYQRFYADQDRLFNRLSGLSGTGQTATMQTAGLSQNTANNIAGMTTAQGNARGASQIAQGNAWGNAVQSAGNTIGNQFGNSPTYNPNTAYNSAGQFTPFYTGYDSSGGSAYG